MEQPEIYLYFYRFTFPFDSYTLNQANKPIKTNKMGL